MSKHILDRNGCDSASVMCSEAAMHNRPARGDKTTTNTKEETTMKLQELFNQNSQYQVVLSFSNDDMVLITHESFEPNSKFMRRSKIRLDQTFSLYESKDDMDIYKTNRGKGKCDYILYVNRGEYMVLELIRKKYEYKTIVRGKSNHHGPEGAPDREPIIHAHPHARDDELWILFSYNSEKLYEEHFPRKDYTPDGWHSYYGYYVAILRSMSILIEHDELNAGVKQLIIHEGDTAYDKRITWNVLLGKYKAKNKWTQKFVKEFEHLKARLQLRGITVSYELEITA